MYHLSSQLLSLRRRSPIWPCVITNAYRNRKNGNLPTRPEIRTEITKRNLPFLMSPFRDATSIHAIQHLYLQHEQTALNCLPASVLEIVKRVLRDQEVASSNLVTPTVCQKKPFGENVEGLSHCGNESYIIEAGVQKLSPRTRPCRRESGPAHPVAT